MTKTITATYYQDNTVATSSPGNPPIPTGSVGLVLSDGSTMTLAETISADGARYANANESFVFWSKGNTALVLQNGKEQSYTGCIAVAPDTLNNLPSFYSNSSMGFSIRLPSLTTSVAGKYTNDYSVDDTYTYQELGPGKTILGTKFTIPASTAAGTNLNPDSYLSVEEIPNVSQCSASLFLERPVPIYTVVEADTTYSVASSTGAAAGNRYEETVYALPGTNPCTAIRYFIHYGVMDNYPGGIVHEFDEQALHTEFDAIRRSLILAQ